jgi:uncharacterized protein YhfF
MEPDVLEYWQSYLGSLPSGVERKKTPDDVFSFGNSKVLADKLADLVLKGIKTATCSRFVDYEAERAPLPQAGNISVLVDGSGSPVAVIETLSVFLAPFNEIPEWFAYAEGEGNGSLSYWQVAHRRYSSEQCPNSEPFSENLPLVCEQFRVVYQTSR